MRARQQRHVALLRQTRNEEALDVAYTLARLSK